MDFIGLCMILTGAYLLWASATNRRPGDLAKQVIADPKNAPKAVASAETYGMPTNLDVHPQAYATAGTGTAVSNALAGALAGAASAAGASDGVSTASLLSASTGGYGAAAVASARTQLGKPYLWGAAGPGAYDCSGLVSWAYKQAGHDIGRITTATVLASPRTFPKVDRASMQVGDLLFPYPGHMGMVIDQSTFIEARGEVRISPIKTIMTIRRVT